MKQICVVGVGYVGLVTAACFTDLVNRIIALDSAAPKMEGLRKGVLPFYEPGLEELVERNVRARRLSFTTSHAEALAGAEFAFICVGTLSDLDGEADFRYLATASQSIALNMSGPLIIINKSTVPVGTGDWVADIIRRHQKEEIPFWVVSCPEFLRGRIGDRRFYATAAHDIRLPRARGGGKSGPAPPAPARPDHDHRFAHRRNDQICLQCFPGHQNFIHQRDRQRV